MRHTDAEPCVPCVDFRHDSIPRCLQPICGRRSCGGVRDPYPIRRPRPPAGCWPVEEGPRGGHRVPYSSGANEPDWMLRHSDAVSCFHLSWPPIIARCPLKPPGRMPPHGPPANIRRAVCSAQGCFFTPLKISFCTSLNYPLISLQHPKDVIPKRKAAEFGLDGRPFHPFFYTGKPQYFQLMHVSPPSSLNFHPN